MDYRPIYPQAVADPWIGQPGRAALQGQPCSGLCILALELGDKISRALDLAGGADALAATPDVFPGFGLVAAKIHLARVALRQVLGVQARSPDAGRQVVAVHARKKPGILSATVMTFAHTLGEFGVVLMVGGNIPGETQTVAIAIYDRVQAFDEAAAGTMSLALLLVSLATIAVSYGLAAQLVKARRG